MAGQLEIETTLAIVADNPLEVVGELLQLTSLASYPLRKAAPQNLRDAYYDTAGLSLRQQGFGLRIRSVNGMAVIGLKGPDQKTDWGGVARQEIEAPWSAEAIDEVAHELRRVGIEITSPESPVVAGPPEKCLAAMGLERAHSRETYRQIRHLLPGVVGENQILAELAIDSVTYYLERQPARHYELEIEAKSPDGPVVIQAVTKALLRQFGGKLRPWDYGKSSTGRALRILLDKGNLESLAGKDNALKPATYDLLEQMFQQP